MIKTKKLLIAGFPCTKFSIARGANRETEPGGEGWELFVNCVIALERFNPDFFLFENNRSMHKNIREAINAELGVEPTPIDSALVSAQSRKRLYWNNFGDVPQPVDRGILLKDILESGCGLHEKAYTLTATYDGAIPSNTFARHQREMVAEPAIFQTPHGYNKGGVKCEKAPCLNANGCWQENNKVIEPIPLRDKSNTLRAGAGNKQGECNGRRYIESGGQFGYMPVPVRIGTIEHGGTTTHDSKPYRVYATDGKSVTLQGEAGGLGAKTGLYACEVPETWNGKPVYRVMDGLIEIKGKSYPVRLPDGLYIIRKLTPVECERLQTLPDNYTAGVSNNQRYKMLGNGWTAEVIIHLLAHGLKDVPRDEELVVLSLYDGLGTGRYCLDKLGFTNVRYYAYEVDPWAIKVAMANYPDIRQCGDAFDVRADD